VTDKPT